MQRHERILIKKSMTNAQICIWCGELMTKGETAISLRNNPGTTLTLKKNLWLHKRCREGFAGHLMYDLATQFEELDQAEYEDDKFPQVN
jgi:hypothetical protein